MSATPKVWAQTCACSFTTPDCTDGPPAEVQVLEVPAGRPQRFRRLLNKLAHGGVLHDNRQGSTKVMAHQPTTLESN